jgi:hypothetical protein
MPSGNQHQAQFFESAPKVILWRAEIAQPKRHAVVSVEQGEAYRLDAPEPADDEFVTVAVTRLSASEAADLPLPSNE